MKKLFIVGCPRSGTTLVQQALNRHSRIVLPPETKFFFAFLGHALSCQHRHVDFLNADLQIDMPKPAAQVRSAADARTFYEDMARRYVARVQKSDAAYFGEKSPAHTGHLPRIRQLFPNAKILVLYRDGRDVARSLTKVPWMSSDVYVNFMVWLYYQRIVRKARQRGLPNAHFVRYESLVADPEQEFGRILHFLDLPYEPAVAEGYGNREGIPAREYPWKARALEKITNQRVGSFRRELSAEQIAHLERLGGRTLTSLGYELITDGRKALSPGFVLRLAHGMARLVYRRPWHSLLNQIGRAHV